MNKCYICEQKATAFCELCNVYYCELHAKEHDTSFFIEGKTRPIEEETK